MCFAPQRRALFRHLNFQKWSEPLAFLTFWLRNVLRATTACNFLSLIRPGVSAPRRFSEPTFQPSEATSHWKTHWINFSTFSRTCIFFLLTLSLLWSSLFCSSLFYSFPFCSSIFYSSLLSDSSHLCFSSVHIVGSLTSKLSSIRVPNFYNGMAAHHKNQVFGPYPIHSPMHHSLCNTDPNNVVVQFIQFCWLCITPCTFCSDPQSTARWKEF